MAGDPEMTCPYDKSHAIRRTRFAYHVAKCAKQHPKSKKKACPYDRYHFVDASEYDDHVKNCPALRNALHFGSVDADVQEAATHNQNTVATSSSSAQGNQNDGSWPSMSYNPLQNIEERAIVRPLIGASKSAKKEFREQERRRIQQLAKEKEREEKQQAENAKKVVPAKANKPMPSTAANTAVTESSPATQTSAWGGTSQTSAWGGASQASAWGGASPSCEESSEPTHFDITSFLSSQQQSRQRYASNEVMPWNTGMEPESSSSGSSSRPSNTGAAPKTVPFSYASALGKKTTPFECVPSMFPNTPANISARSQRSQSEGQTTEGGLDTQREQSSTDSAGASRDRYPDVTQGMRNLTVNPERYQKVGKNGKKKKSNK